MTSGINAKSRLGKQDFVYVAADDVNLCSAGERLTYHFANEEDGKTLRVTACRGRALKVQYKTGKQRRISRRAHDRDRCFVPAQKRYRERGVVKQSVGLAGRPPFCICESPDQLCLAFGDISGRSGKA